MISVSIRGRDGVCFWLASVVSRPGPTLKLLYPRNGSGRLGKVELVTEKQISPARWKYGIILSAVFSSLISFAPVCSGVIWHGRCSVSTEGMGLKILHISNQINKEQEGMKTCKQHSSANEKVLTQQI